MIKRVVLSACISLVLMTIQDEEQQTSQYEIVFASICNSSRIKLPADGCAVGGLSVNVPKASLFPIGRT